MKNQALKSILALRHLNWLWVISLLLLWWWGMGVPLPSSTYGLIWVGVVGLAVLIVLLEAWEDLDCLRFYQSMGSVHQPLFLRTPLVRWWGWQGLVEWAASHDLAPQLTASDVYPGRPWALRLVSRRRAGGGA